MSNLNTVSNNPFVCLYAIQNNEGKWFRAKGLKGYGKSWVDDLVNARIYPKKGSARAQVTYFSSHYPEYGIPKLIELPVYNLIELIEEEERVKKALGKKSVKEAEYQQILIKYRKEQALKDLENAKKRLEEFGAEGLEF